MCKCNGFYHKRGPGFQIHIAKCSVFYHKVGMHFEKYAFPRNANVEISIIYGESILKYMRQPYIQ